jgi:HEAT repeat protein
MSNVIVFLTTIIVLFSYSITEGQTKKSVTKQPAVKTINVVDAINEGKIKVEAEGAGLSAVRIKVIRLTEEKIKILVPVGILFVNREGKAQDMVSTSKVILDLTQRKEISYSIPAACANAYKPIPDSSDRFDIEASPKSEELRKLMEVIGRKRPGEVVTQVAVWIVTDDISRNVLDSRYRTSGPFVVYGGASAASNEDVIKAIKIVEEAGIDIRSKTIVTEKVSALRAIESKDREIQRYAKKILGKENKENVEIFIDALKDKNWLVRITAAEALGKTKDIRVVEQLIESLEYESKGAESYRRVWIGGINTSKQVMLTIAKALGEIGDPRAIEPLLKTLKTIDSGYAHIIGVALGKINDPRVVELLSAMLEKESYSERVKVARALRYAGGIGDVHYSRAVKSLIKALKDENPNVRREAAELGEILRGIGKEKLVQKEPRIWGDAIEALIEALKDKNVRDKAAVSLSLITGKYFGEDQAKWQKWWEENKAKYLK